MININIENIYSKIMNCAYEVHKELGPGLFENVYKQCLAFELKEQGLYVEIEKPLPVRYKGYEMDFGYKIDLMVENCIIIELKSVKEIQDIHLTQILTYMKLAKIELGMLVNFNSKYLKTAMKRVKL